jgi:hypothetical protein
VTKPVIYAAAPVQQLARRRLWLRLELRTPVPERLQRQALRVAIFPLIQVAALPRFMMRPPERLTMARPGAAFSTILISSSFQTRKGEQIATDHPATSVRSRYAYLNSL